MTKTPEQKYKCLLCGRVMNTKDPHNCNHGFRKRGLKWSNLTTLNPVVQQSLTTESVKCYICKKELKGYGYESPLDGERVCENCFSRDQYVNDNTDWDNSVVKENLTSEENLITAISPQLKTPEEKAREEAETMISEYANNSHISREYYAEGYLSGYHSRYEEVKELREALKFCEIALKNIADPISYLLSEADKSGSKVDGRGLIEFANNGCCISNMAKDALVKLEKLKAKQLLKED